MKRGHLIAGVAVALIVGALYLWRSPALSEPAPMKVAAQAPPAAEPNVLVEPDEGAGEFSPAAQATESSAGEGRSEVEAAILTGRLTNADGAPVSGATVTWTTLHESFLKAWSGWDLQDWEAVERATRSTLSTSAGEFRFVSGPPEHGEMATAVWITGVGVVARMELLEPIAAPVQLGSIELLPAPLMTVRVVDMFETPVAGALVEQFYSVPWDWRADEFDPQAARVFARAWTTRADGTVEVAWIDGKTLLQASLEGQASEVWSGQPRRELTLKLTGTFQASGTVSFADGMEVPDNVHIMCLAELGGSQQVLASAPVSGSGQWGPVDLALGRADGFRFRLEGSDVSIVEEYIPPPPPGQLVTLNFEAHPGALQWVLVVDENGEPLMDAQVTMSWERKGVRTTSIRKARDEDGYMVFGDLPHGTVACAAECPGYASILSFTYLLVPPDPPSSHIITLVPGGRVTGRVVSSGDPIEDFEVTWWPSGDGLDSQTASFESREDGEFELETVPLGHASFFACAQGLAPSDIVEVEITEESSPEIVLEPRDALRGRGRVVAADTGLPLPDAVLQPFRTDRHDVVAPWGPPHQVQSDGSFDITGFAEGQTRVRFSRPGYSHRWVETNTSPGETVEFGSVALSGRQSLQVQLVWEGELDPIDFSFQSFGAEPLPSRKFDADGILNFEGVSSGVYKFLVGNGHDPAFEVTAICEPGEDWLFQIPVGGPRSLRIEVLPRPGTTLGSEIYLRVNLPGLGDRKLTQLDRLGPNGVVTFLGVLPGPYSVRVRSEEGSVASAEGTIPADALRTDVRVYLGSESQRVRLVDGDGAPVSMAWIGIVDPARPQIGQGGTTDEVGEFPLTLTPGDYLAAISHGELGHRYDVPVKVLGHRDEVLDLVLDTPFHVEVQLLDGTQPQAGLQCRLHDLAGNNSVPPVNSDAQGLARWDRFAEGSYGIHIRHPDYWPTIAEAPARMDDLSTPIQVRRLGSLELKARSVTTGLAKGLAIDLVSEEFGTPVRTWLQGELVTSSDQDLATDLSGHLRLDGLPHGAYSWSARAATGELVTGFATVPPGGLGQTTLVLP